MQYSMEKWNTTRKREHSFRVAHLINVICTQESVDVKCSHFGLRLHILRGYGSSSSGPDQRHRSQENVKIPLPIRNTSIVPTGQLRL